MAGPYIAQETRVATIDQTKIIRHEPRPTEDGQQRFPGLQARFASKGGMGGRAQASDSLLPFQITGCLSLSRFPATNTSAEHGAERDRPSFPAPIIKVRLEMRCPSIVLLSNIIKHI